MAVEVTALRPQPDKNTAAPGNESGSTIHTRIASQVLCVDFDGTLVSTDSLFESLILAVRIQPSIIFHIPLWLLRGRAYFKDRVTGIAADTLLADLFPRRSEVVALIESARIQGCRTELISAAPQILLERSGDTSSFDAIFGSRDGINLKGANKAKFLKERHPGGFAYVGDSFADILVWAEAQERFGVALSPGLRRRIKSAGMTVEEIAPYTPWFPALLREMRPHQWVKNLLVFVSLGLAVQSVDQQVFTRFLATFIAFCLLTSGTYIVNDLTDLASDRQHPRKRFRPIASGRLPIAIAIPSALLLIVAGLLIAAAASLAIGTTLLVYLGLTITYSFGIKRLAIVDVLTVATLFTARIVAGAFAYEAPVSRWIIVFSLFFFTSLALMKRTVECRSLGVEGNNHVAIAGRGYRAGDYSFLLAMGVSFGVGALIVFSLYVSEMTNVPAQYHSPEGLWVAVGALGFWMMRMWLQTTRGEMNDDPILYAVKDRVSIGIGLAVFAIALLAQIL
jgi:4-hydroxybenzoate polyprenyltransferase